MNSCYFCKTPGHKIKDCTALKQLDGSKCKGKGHTATHCPQTDMEVHFPPLPPGKGISTPSMKKPLEEKKVKGSSKKHQGINPYAQLVDSRAEDWILQAQLIFGGDLWFNKYQKKTDKTFEDPFLGDVQRTFFTIVDQLRFATDLEEEEAFYRAEKEDDDFTQKKKAERKSLLESMTPEELAAFLKKEEDAWDDSDDSDDDYCTSELHRYTNFIDSLADNEIKQAEWSAFLAQEEKSQEEYRERQSVNRYKGRPRHGLTLGSFM